MNENINLVEILKDCPTGTPLYCVIHGDVEFFCIDRNNHTFPIKLFISNTKYYTAVTKEGKYIDDCNGECILFPSKEQRDWSKFNINKPKFNPDTLKPFDKILVRDSEDDEWKASFFSHINDNRNIITTSVPWNYNIPFNNDTKRLIGTKDNAPKYYRYWEE